MIRRDLVVERVQRMSSFPRSSAIEDVLRVTQESVLPWYAPSAGEDASRSAGVRVS